jgi:Bacterial Ig domain
MGKTARTMTLRSSLLNKSFFVLLGFLRFATLAQSIFNAVPSATAAVPSSAAFVKTDTTTQGSWKGVCGTDGYTVVNDSTNYPSYATVAPSGQSSYTWDGSPTDLRALLRASSGRTAATWFASTNFQVDVNLIDSNSHQIALYMVDWDSTVRSQRIDVLDASNNRVLDTRTVSSFNGGKYLVWNISGHVIFKISTLAGGDCVLSGLFFGVPDHRPPIVNLTAPAAYSTLTGTVVISANVSGHGTIAGVQFRVDGNNMGVEVPNLPYSTVLDTTTLINGTHTISATARDGVNNTAFSSVTVNNSATLNNPIKIENAQTGTNAWKLTTPATNGQIEGFASLTSVNIGGQIKLFVNTPDPSYTMDIYRMGWYDGAGARELSRPITLPGIVQPAPTVNSTTGLIECHWTNPYVLSVPTNWVSGVYLVKLTALPSGKQSYIIFDVRDDARPSDIVFQSSVTTYEAYNPWGGKSLYPFNSSNGVQAQKVSFNRPYGSGYGSAITGVGAGHFLTTNAPVNYGSGALEGWEYNMVRWLERNGYDVTYLTDVDVHENGNVLFNHRAFLSVGHDEYWSWNQRQNVENARDHGINLAFFAANVCYWQIRFERGLDGQVDRTMVGYKESAFTADPYALDSDPTNDKYITTYWRQNNTKPPEDALVGVAYFEDPVNADIVISDASGWMFQSTGLSSGSRLTGLLGYEVDRTLGNAPRSLRVLASSPTPSGVNATMTVYTAASGAQVFAAGSMQWVWGLDNDYFTPNLRPSLLNTAAQQMVVNILTRFTHWNRPVDRRK